MSNFRSSLHRYRLLSLAISFIATSGTILALLLTPIGSITPGEGAPPIPFENPKIKGRLFLNAPRKMSVSETAVVSAEIAVENHVFGQDPSSIAATLDSPDFTVKLIEHDSARLYWRWLLSSVKSEPGERLLFLKFDPPPDLSSSRLLSTESDGHSVLIHLSVRDDLGFSGFWRNALIALGAVIAALAALAAVVGFLGKEKKRDSEEEDHQSPDILKLGDRYFHREESENEAQDIKRT